MADDVAADAGCHSNIVHTYYKTLRRVTLIKTGY